jgi:hypothetical protein
MMPLSFMKSSTRFTLAGLIAAVSILLPCRQQFALAAENSFAPAAHTITKFNVPGAGKSKGQGTIGDFILNDGSIVGWYYDSNSIAHGFLRSPSGKITRFDPRGSVATSPTGMNSKLAIVGYYTDANGGYHGFLRSSQGKITTLNHPKAGKGSGQGTLAGDINTSGEIVGYYLDSNNVYHGFVRTSAGKYTRLDAPNAGTGQYQGTQPAFGDGFTDAGAVTGTYHDSKNNSHGFVRAPDGHFTTIDIAGSFGTYIAGINAKNVIAGQYVSSDFFGFLRAPNGKVTSFSVLKGAPGFSVGTINDSGAITGWYYDAQIVAHGYVRDPNGRITMFSVPGAGTGNSQGTLAYANNSTGEITGLYVDSNGVYHGFLRK